MQFTIASRQCRARILSTLCHYNKLGLWKLLLIIQTFVRSCIQKVVPAYSRQPLFLALVLSCFGIFAILVYGNMVRLIVIAVAVFLGIYLVSRWLDKRQPSTNDDAVVSDGAGKVLIIISAVVAVLLFALILPRFGVSSGGLFHSLLNFLPLVRTLLPFWPTAADKCDGFRDLIKGVSTMA